MSLVHTTRRFSFSGGKDEDELIWGMIDILTLILIFFILFYAREVSQKNAANSASAPAPVQRLDGPSVPRLPVENENSFGSMENSLEEAMAARFGDNFYLKHKEGQIIIVLGEAISFANGEADLLANAVDILKTVTEQLRTAKDYNLIISGHTDDVPISNSAYASNWDLSAARAVAVARYFIAHGIDPKRITAQGFAEFRPVDTNDTEAGRRLNRRVEIALSKTNPDVASKEVPVTGRDEEPMVIGSPIL